MEYLFTIGKRVFILFGLMTLIILVMDFNTRMAGLTRLSAQYEQDSANITQMYVTKEGIQTQIAYATSPAAVEEWAREGPREGLEGDYSIIPQAGGAYTPEADILETPSVDPLDFWDTWIEWFFGPSS